MIDRAQIKNVLLRLIGAAAPLVWAASSQPRLLVLMYHRVLPFGHPARQYEQRGMIVSPEVLDRQIQAIRRHFNIVHLDQWVRDADSGASLPPLSCALTFDDGWRDNFVYGYPVLRASKAPATIFLVSDLVGSNYGFWPTRLARLLRSTWLAKDDRAVNKLRSLCPEVAIPTRVAEARVAVEIDQVLCLLKERYDDRQMLSILTEIEPSSGARTDSDLLQWAEISEMADSGLIRFGSHTRTHTRLVEGLDPEVRTAEILGSASDLEVSLKSPVTMFCYPNGDHDQAAVETVRNRYACAVTTSPGWNLVSTDRAVFRRVGVHDGNAGSSAQFIGMIAMACSPWAAR